MKNTSAQTTTLSIFQGLTS